MVVDDPTTTLFFDGETVEPLVRLSSGYLTLDGLDYDLEDVWNNMMPVKSLSGKTATYTKKPKKTEKPGQKKKRNHASMSCGDDIVCVPVAEPVPVGQKDPVSVSFCGELVERVLYTNGFNKKVCVDNGDDDGPREALKADDVVLDVIQLSLLNANGGKICVWLWKSETAKMKICLPSKGCLDIANDQQDIKDIMNMVATECLHNILKVHGFCEDEMYIKDIEVNFITGHVMLNRSIRINQPSTTWAKIFSLYDSGSFTFDTAVNVKPPYNVIRVWFDMDKNTPNANATREIEKESKNTYQYKINVNTGYIIILNTKCPSVMKRAAEGIINAIEYMHREGHIGISAVVRQTRVGKFASCGIKKGPGRPTKEQARFLLQYNHNHNLFLKYNQI